MTYKPSILPYGVNPSVSAAAGMGTVNDIRRHGNAETSDLVNSGSRKQIRNTVRKLVGSAYRYGRTTALVCLSLLSLFFFFSCEMKKELTGQIEKPSDNVHGVPLEQAGLLDLELKPQKEASIPTKGDITGSDIVMLDVNEFSVDILDSIGDVYKHYESYAQLKEEGGLILPAGKYFVRAMLGEDINAGFDSPFYAGTDACEITPQEVKKVITECVLTNKKVTFRCSDQFLSRFEDDYSIVIDNGNGALTTHRDEVRTAYLKNTGTLQFTVYSTLRKGQKDLVYSYDLSKENEVKEHNNIVVDLGIVDENGGSGNPGGDTPGGDDEPADPGDPEYPDGSGHAVAPLIKVDVSLVEKDYVIEIPSDFVDAGGSDTPGGDTPGGDEPSATKPTIQADGFSFGTPVEISADHNNVTVRVIIRTPAKLASLKVGITSPVLEPLLETIGLGSTFDMCNLTPAQATTLTGLGLAIPSKGGTQTTFDISSFMPMIAILKEPGDYLFKITAVDEAGQSASNTLTVRMK